MQQIPAAWGLVNSEQARADLDITVYQLGWRLGGKGGKRTQRRHPQSDRRAWAPHLGRDVAERVRDHAFGVRTAEPAGGHASLRLVRPGASRRLRLFCRNTAPRSPSSTTARGSRGTWTCRAIRAFRAMVAGWPLCASTSSWRSTCSRNCCSGSIRAGNGNTRRPRRGAALLGLEAGLACARRCGERSGPAPRAHTVPAGGAPSPQACATRAAGIACRCQHAHVGAP